MRKKIWAVAKANLKNLKIAYAVAGATTGAILIQNGIKSIVAIAGGMANDEISIGAASYAWLLPLLAAVLIPARNFRKIANLGGRRDDFFWGSLAVHAILACAAALAYTAITYGFDNPISKAGYFMDVINVTDVFGWTSHGAAVAFVQQFSFLFLTAAAVHTLAAAQGKWYGWAADLAIAAIISVFTPIAPLRAVLAGFFALVIFHPNALLQIAVCLALAAALYSLNKPILARKAI